MRRPRSGSGSGSRTALALALALAGAAPDAAADTLDDSDYAPWEVCGLCHGLNGVSATGRFPMLAGQDAAYLARQVRAFRSGQRTNDGGQMRGVAGELDEQDIARVAGWFAGQPPPPPLTPDQAGLDPRTARLARDLYTAPGRAAPPCAVCHDTGPGPRLRAQHPAYLAKQLRDFRDGRRHDAPDGAMARATAGLRDAQIDALAAWLATEARFLR